MQRQIVMTEQELDVLINTAFIAGVQAEHICPGLMRYTDTTGKNKFRAVRDNARDSLKEHMFR